MPQCLLSWGYLFRGSCGKDVLPLRLIKCRSDYTKTKQILRTEYSLKKYWQNLKFFLKSLFYALYLDNDVYIHFNFMLF